MRKIIATVILYTISAVVATGQGVDWLVSEEPPPSLADLNLNRDAVRVTMATRLGKPPDGRLVLGAVQTSVPPLRWRQASPSRGSWAGALAVVSHDGQGMRANLANDGATALFVRICGSSRCFHALLPPMSKTWGPSVFGEELIVLVSNQLDGQ